MRFLLGVFACALLAGAVTLGFAAMQGSLDAIPNGLVWTICFAPWIVLLLRLALAWRHPEELALAAAIASTGVLGWRLGAPSALPWQILAVGLGLLGYGACLHLRWRSWRARYLAEERR
ncbi:MAG: hypothetical protein M5U26_11215 [Planctomycetota bacterium]|nr:hypothetical protein [Planctomycetota bacterium]